MPADSRMRCKLTRACVCDNQLVLEQHWNMVIDHCRPCGNVSACHNARTRAKNSTSIACLTYGSAGHIAPAGLPASSQALAGLGVHYRSICRDLWIQTLNQARTRPDLSLDALSCAAAVE